jgi:hypothetical protein
MLNIKKAEVAKPKLQGTKQTEAITVSRIFNNLVSLSLFLALFCLPGYFYAQTPLRGFLIASYLANQPALDFPPGKEFDPRHL